MVIIALIAVVVFGFMVCQPINPYNEEGKAKDGDFQLYQNIVEQIHTGKDYYSAADNELHKMGYATRSVFNWRLPVLAWLLGHLQSIRTGQILVFVLALISLLIWMTAFYQKRYDLWQTFLGGMIISGPVIYSFMHGPVMFHEFWAGTLIALSLGAYARGWRIAAVISGLMALLLRELSLPFVCVMMVLAYMEGQRREALFWLIGILAFGGELLLHWSIVSKLITENDRTIQGGWIVFSGWPFVLRTAQMNVYLLAAPPWITAIIMPLSLLGLAGWRDELGLRVACTVGIYVLAFLMVGRPVNVYWGLMYNFVLPLGLLHAPAALRDLWQPIQTELLPNKAKS